MDKVTEHKTVGSIGTVVYDHRTLSEVQDAAEAIRYPALKLPVVGRLRAGRRLFEDDIQWDTPREQDS